MHPDFQNVIILEPDGWDRTLHGWFKSWNTKIDREEFEARLAKSTVLIDSGDVST